MAFPRLAFLANNLLQSCLLAKGYDKVDSTPGLWRHKWRHIQSCLIVDDFRVEYVGIEHFNHLCDVLKKFHGVQFNMAGNKFAGIDIKWDYAARRFCISIPSYIKNLLIKVKHSRPTKPRLSPRKCLPIPYGAKAQLVPDSNTSELLGKHCKHHIQEIVSLLLYYSWAVNNKLLVALSAIAAQQSCATIATEQAVHLLLDYVATYPSDGIIY
jgi:hypothetical protein